MPELNIGKTLKLTGGEILEMAKNSFKSFFDSILHFPDGGMEAVLN